MRCWSGMGLSWGVGWGVRERKKGNKKWSSAGRTGWGWGWCNWRVEMRCMKAVVNEPVRQQRPSTEVMEGWLGVWGKKHFSVRHAWRAQLLLVKYNYHTNIQQKAVIKNLKPVDGCLFFIRVWWEGWLLQLVVWWSLDIIRYTATTSHIVTVIKYHVWCSSSTKLLDSKLSVWNSNVRHSPTVSDVCTYQQHHISML